MSILRPKVRIRVGIERRRAALNIVLGLAITAVFLLVQHYQGLIYFERLAYDAKLRLFQLNNPGPTQRLLHLDMNDEAMDKIGPWPWPRERIARLVDEIARAKASVLMFDIIFDEKSPLGAADDAALARSMKAFGRVVLPASVELRSGPATRPSAEEDRIKEMLLKDLARDDKSIINEIQLNQEIGKEKSGAIQDEISRLRKQLCYDRVYAALRVSPNRTAADLRKELFPNMDVAVSISPWLDMLDRTLTQCAKDMELLDRFTYEIPKDGAPELYTVISSLTPVKTLQDAAAWSGTVDTVTEPDGKVRTKPLFVNYKGRMLPSASFMTALALLNVDPKTLEISADEIRLTRPDGTTCHIPVRTVRGEGGQSGGLVMNIGWWGGTDWLTMYDFPNYKKTKQHLNVSEVWNAIILEDRIQINRTALAKLLNVLLDDIDESDDGKIYVPFQNKLSGYRGRQEYANRPGPWNPETLTAEDFANYVKIYRTQVPAILTKLRAQEKAEGKQPERLREILEYDGDLGKTVHELDNLENELKNIRETLHREFDGKAVIMGWTATGKVDRYPTPVHSNAAPGVLVHGAVVNGIVQGYMWGNANPGWALVAVSVLGLGTTLALSFFNPAGAFLSTLLLILSWVLVNGIVLFNFNRVIVDMVAPTATAAVVWGTVTLVRYITDLGERRRIQRRFSSYVDPQLVEYVIEHPDQDTFGGIEKEISVCFTDLEGSTNMGEALGKGIVQVLNEYMGAMTPAVRSRRGLIDKFLGDGIMFMFNALETSETHAADAVATALQMQDIQVEFNKLLTERGLPNLGTRIGINTGLMIMGDAGSRDAANFTVLGDNVNLASRMEGANKPFGSRINISDRTYELCREQFCFRPLGRIRVKGKENAVMCWEPLCEKEKLTPEIEQKIALSTAVFNAFVEARFEACMRACDAMDAALGTSKYTAIYHKSAMHCLAEGAGDVFDGVITLTDK